MLRVSSLGPESHVFPQFNGIITPSSSGALFRAGVELIRVLFKVQSWKSRHNLAKRHEHFQRLWLCH